MSPEDPNKNAGLGSTLVKLVFAAVSLVPPLSPLLPIPAKLSAILEPPVGDYKAIASAFYIVVAAIAIFWKPKRVRSRATFKLAATAAPIIALYLLFWVARVHTVFIPAANKSISVVTGFVRSPRANLLYPGASDTEILGSEGPYDTTVDAMWTQKSVIAARWAAIVLYVMVGGTITPLIAAVGVEISEVVPDMSANS